MYGFRFKETGAVFDVSPDQAPAFRGGKKSNHVHRLPVTHGRETIRILSPIFSPVFFFCKKRYGYI